MKVIVDTDFGDDIDDTFALGYLLKERRNDIALILSDFGDTGKRAELICGFLERCGASEIEVGAGVSKKFREPYQYRFREQHPVNKSYNRDGIDRALELISESNEDIAIIAIGPATNLSEIFRRIPEHAHKLKIYGMFGSIRKGYFGKMGADREYNVASAEHEFVFFLEHAKNIRITPLDTCGEIILDGKRYQRLLSAEDPVTKTVMEDFFRWKSLGFVSCNEETSVLYDTAAVYMTLNGSLLRYEDLEISVSEGLTIETQNGFQVNTATSWIDREAFLEELTKAFEK